MTTTLPPADAPVRGPQRAAVPDAHGFLQHVPSRGALALNAALALGYTLVICFAFQHGDPVLFALLVATELFHLAQIVGYCWTVWGREGEQRLAERPFARGFAAPVDVFITVCGEPVDVVRRTAVAAAAMDYPGPVAVHLLNDGLVARKEGWRQVEELAAELGIGCFTRTTAGGAKAGNINHALERTGSPFVVVFDADHVPHRDFLTKVMGYFTDARVGFVQTPQFYANQNDNEVTRVAWEQQTLFFGPIMSGKSRLDSAFMCGTNMAVRRSALDEVGGMCETNIAEDFLTSLFLHERGWRSVYRPEVLAEGLAPDDFLNYYKQQFRWTRGSLEVIFKYNPLLRRGLTPSQRLQYLLSAGYYLSGAVVLLDALLPLVFLLTGRTPVVTDTMTLALVFVPYMWVNLMVLQRTSNHAYSYRAISFSLSAWWLQLVALSAVATGRRTSFSVTSKAASTGGRPNFLRLAVPQLVYAAVAVIAAVVGAEREGASASLLANLAWLVAHLAIAAPFVLAAAPSRRSRRRTLDLRNDVVALPETASTHRPAESDLVRLAD